MRLRKYFVETFQKPYFHFGCVYPPRFRQSRLGGLSRGVFYLLIVTLVPVGVGCTSPPRGPIILCCWGTVDLSSVGVPALVVVTALLTTTFVRPI